MKDRLKRLLNPWTAAFLLGVVFLTAMPLLQRRFLKAPPPLGPLGSWTLVEVGSNATRAAGSFGGKVLLATFAPQACDAPCRERHAGLVRALEHTDDLGDSIHLVTFAAPGAAGALQPSTPTHARFHLLTGALPQLDVLAAAVRGAWDRFAGTDAGTTAWELLGLPAYMVVDQQGNIRGFWRDDVAGRGNAINAAWLLAKHGGSP